MPQREIDPTRIDEDWEGNNSCDVPFLRQSVHRERTDSQRKAGLPEVREIGWFYQRWKKQRWYGFAQFLNHHREQRKAS